jgi:hypothetical protein
MTKTETQSTLTKQEQFFYDHAGFSFDPTKETQEQGKLRCARQMAKAETWAVQNGYMFETMPDPDADESFMDDEPQEYQDEWRGKAFVTIMYGPGGDIKQSLGGSYGDHLYKHVVRAELAWEEMPAEKASVQPAIGSRVEIPVHYDMWMRGARFGVVTAFRHGGQGQSDYVLVKLDHPQAKRSLKVWRLDWEYMKVIA